MIIRNGIDQERIEPLNKKGSVAGGYVLYWMQQSQRASDNHALEYAVNLANEKSLPVVVLFCLMDDYPDANLRHYTFMLEGLRETRAALKQRGITMVVRHGFPPDEAVELAARACCLVCDRGYMPHQRVWRERVAKKAHCQVIQVESDVVVPVRVASGKAEFSARTIRPKIHRYVQAFLHDIPQTGVKKPSINMDMESLDLEDLDALTDMLDIDRSVSPVSRFFTGGTDRAKSIFHEFMHHKLERYDSNSNQPQTDDVSHMSPYLHFGQISPVYLAREILQFRDRYPDSADAFLEQLIVRRELAMNFVTYTPDFHSLTCLPDWAQKTLREHAHDRREYTYTLEELEHAQTHDEYWNAAMHEMCSTGFMHNYMRMYWGKKVLQWSASPDKAFHTLVYLNNKYFLDGRDPNSYTGVAWIFGLHDRAWNERSIFGKVRYMAASGLERKCDIKAYVRKVAQQVQKTTAKV